MNILFCKTCVTPSSRPRVFFNEKGICNACTNAEKKKLINWDERKKEFLNIVDKIKEFSKKEKNNYDCIIPWSGGKDSTSIALKLKNEFDLNPLLVTFSPLIINECGQQNREELLKLGFDSIFFRPNQKIAKLLAKRFFIERGNPKVAWDAGINSIPIKTAINYQIPFVFYAEHGESEYGGLVLSEESKKKRDITEVIEHQIGDYPENWQDENISLSDLEPYIYPSEDQLSKNNITAYYFSYFFRWSMFENYQYVKKMMPNFHENPNGRTEGTFTNFDSLDDKIDSLYYYMQYIKFGFGRAVRDTSRFIQNFQMTRDEALDIVRKYDGEFPKNDLDEVIDYLNMNRLDFEENINKHRNTEVWSKNNNSWKLNFQIK
jgi:N-acetyl sugar amidotransferase